MKKLTGYKNNGKQWWASLSKEEQESYIAKKEKTHRTKKKVLKNETWTNAAGTFRKVWLDSNCYSVTRVKN